MTDITFPAQIVKVQTLQMGRPPKLTPEVQREICRAIRIGATREVAALAVGISERTLYYWKERGETERKRLKEPRARERKREAPYLQFLQALECAEAEGELTHLEAIAADGAAGSKWILSRRHPDRWAQVRKEELSGPGGEPLPAPVIYLPTVVDEGDDDGEGDG